MRIMYWPEEDILQSQFPGHGSFLCEMDVPPSKIHLPEIPEDDLLGAHATVSLNVDDGITYLTINGASRYVELSEVVIVMDADHADDYTYKTADISGSVPPLVDRETWDAAQRALHPEDEA